MTYPFDPVVRQAIVASGSIDYQLMGEQQAQGAIAAQAAARARAEAEQLRGTAFLLLLA